MPSKSEVVKSFELIKSEARCDDLKAAILTLAQRVSFVNVSLQVSDSGYPEKIGEGIAEAIKGLTKGGA